jgi:hypothetical protein
MNTKQKLAELKMVQANADAIRQALGINPPGKVLFLRALNVTGDDVVVVEADGFGGATTSVVEGSYPVDYIIKWEKSFPSEQDAEAAADAATIRGASPDQVLGVLA